MMPVDSTSDGTAAPTSPAGDARPAARMRLFSSRMLVRIFWEIAVVVVGILIAFGLDAAWERRNKAIEEQDHLRALASDFQQNTERLRTHIEMEERISSRSQMLLLMAAREGPLPADSVSRLLGAVFNSSRYEPVMGAYEALVNSAGLTLIRDDTLRASLAAFSAEVNGRYSERYSDELYFAFIQEFAGRFRFFFESLQGAMPDPKAQAELIRDPKFQDYLALRHLSARDVARRYRGLLKQSEDVLARLNTRID